VNDPLHRFVSLIAGVAGFPALAIAIAMTEHRATWRWGSSFVIAVVCAVVGVSIVIATDSRVYVNAVALLATLGVGVACWRQRDQLGAISAAIMLVGLVFFAVKPAVFNVLQPADFLHLALAAGWLGLSGRYKGITHNYH
jgi:hypothetical protein